MLLCLSLPFSGYSLLYHFKQCHRLSVLKSTYSFSEAFLVFRTSLIYLLSKRLSNACMSSFPILILPFDIKTNTTKDSLFFSSRNTSRDYWSFITLPSAKTAVRRVTISPFLVFIDSSFGGRLWNILEPIALRLPLRTASALCPSLKI